MKGDLSLNTIVVAAIALIVLIVLILIFTGNLGPVNQQFKECPGECVGANTQCPSGLSHYNLGDRDCRENRGGQKCCYNPLDESESQGSLI